MECGVSCPWPIEKSFTLKLVKILWWLVGSQVSDRCPLGYLFFKFYNDFISWFTTTLTHPWPAHLQLHIHSDPPDCTCTPPPPFNNTFYSWFTSNHHLLPPTNSPRTNPPPLPSWLFFAFSQKLQYFVHIHPFPYPTAPPNQSPRPDLLPTFFFKF